VRVHNKKIIKSERKINRKNKNLLIDKILAYNPMLLEGIEVYKDANRNFILLIFLGALLINFPLISVPCCVLSMFFLIRMLQFIKYKSINNVVNKLAKDLTFKGIYNKGIVEDALDDFKAKYGEDVIEYTELVNMLGKYEMLVTKIESALRSINFTDKTKPNHNEEFVVDDGGMSFLNSEDNLNYEKFKRNQYKNRETNNYYKNFNEKLSVLYKNEDGEIKKVNKAIEFFDSENNESDNNENAVVLKNTNKENKNLTVYLYKKSSILQKNVL
jgi:hypothetical protein